MNTQKIAEEIKTFLIEQVTQDGQVDLGKLKVNDLKRIIDKGIDNPINITRSEMIQALKKKIFSNSTEEWKDNTTETLLNWYKKYILLDKTAYIIVE